MEKNLNEKINYKSEYKLMKNNVIYSIIVYMTNDLIFIKCLSYEVKLQFGELSNYINMKFNKLEEEYNYLNNLFISKCIEIKEIVIDNRIVLTVKIYKNNKNEYYYIYIILLYNGINKDYIINKLYNKNIKLEKELQLKMNNFKLEKEGIKEINNFSDNINLKSIINIKTFIRNPKENTFALFKSKDNILNLIYGTKELSIIAYNIDDNIKIIEIKKAHSDDIIGINHYFDKKNKNDLIMSISALNFLNIWNFNNWELMLYLPNINKMGLLSSACFLNYNEECFIITSNSNYGVGTENIKIYNLKGEKIKEINNSNEDTLFIKTYYEEESSKTYIIVCCKNYIKSYDYDNNKLYYKYYENNNGHHFSVLINKNKGLVKLIESCTSDGLIRIWNFHYGNLLYKINTKEKVCSLCLWNNNILLSGSLDGKIIIIDFVNQIVIKSINGHKNWVNFITKFKNNKYGECLVTQGFDDQIQIWSNNI